LLTFGGCADGRGAARSRRCAGCAWVYGTGCPCRTCKTGAVTFESKGEQQCYEVPPGVTELKVTAVGGKGGETPYGVLGGFGALVSAELQTAPGQTLYVEVGSNGCNPSPQCQGSIFGGGGGTGKDAGTGGGASDVRELPLEDEAGEASLLSRLLVAGGGGGAGDIALGGRGGSGDANAFGAGGAGENGRPEGAQAGGQGGKGGTSTAPGKRGEGGSGSTRSGFSGSTGERGAGGFGYGGGGGGFWGGGGGGEGGFSNEPTTEAGGGGGGGAGSSYVVPSGSDVTFVTDTTGIPEVTIAPSCTTAMGQGVYQKVGEPGRLKLKDSLSTNLEAPQMLHVGYESGKVHFRLIKLEHAGCTGEVGERDFQGEGAAAVGTGKASHGYTLSFSIYEKEGGFFFTSKLMKGAELVEASGGPLKKSTEVIH